MKEEKDKSLVKLALEGNQNAFSELNSRYRSQIEIYISDLLGSNGGKYANKELQLIEEPSDITQLALFKAFNNLEKFDPTYEFSTWIYNIARNTAIDCTRKSRIDVERTIKNDHPLLTQSPEDKLISLQSYTSIMERLHSLNEKYREVAKLRFIQELAYDEIAIITNLPLNTVKTRIKRAKEQIKDIKDIDR